jgi:hypothetical protein
VLHSNPELLRENHLPLYFYCVLYQLVGVA